MVSSEMMSIVAPAFMAGLLIVLTHAPLGIEVLKRGIIFIDLAVAQIAGLGIVALDLFMHADHGWIKQGVALSCAFGAGLFFRKIEKSMPEYLEAIIGVCFVVSASLSILLLSDHPHGGEEIQHLLSGQMLFVTWKDLMIHAPIYALILTVWFAKPGVRLGMGFYVLFALAISSSVQLVGVYVVFASLILPALSAVRSTRPHLQAWACGVMAVIAGIIASLMSDLPAGPLLVVSFTIVSVVLFNYPLFPVKHT